MNRETNIAMQFYHYMKVTRDLLEYSMANAKCRLEDFTNRKTFFENALKENGLLNNVLNNNGENGQKVRERLEEFMDIIFNGTIVKEYGESVIVDHSQKMTLLTNVIGVRETFLDIFNSHMKFLKDSKAEVEVDLDGLFAAEDYLYRSLVLLVLNDAIKESFIEFNKYLNESKGEPTPQSNFVANQIGTYISLVNFVTSRKFFEKANYDKEVEALRQELEVIEGKQKIETPQERENVFVNCKASCDRALDESEREWVGVYLPIVKKTNEEA